MNGDKDLEESFSEGDDLEESQKSPSVSYKGNGSRKHGIGTRFQKFVATKTANSKVGRSVILQSIGEDGEKSFNLILEALKMFYGEARAKTVQKEALAIILKVKILIDKKLLTMSQLKDSEEPIHSLLFQIQRDFDVPAEKETKTGRVSPAPLSMTLYELRDLWKNTFNGLMKEKNVAKMTNSLTALGDQRFLEALLNDPKYFQTKKSLDQCFKSLLMNVQILDTKKERNCRFANCSNLAVRSKGLFRSSGFCADHHLQSFQPILSCPTLSHFVYEDEQMALYFLDFLKTMELGKDGVDPMAVYTFLISVNQWRSISSNHMRVKRAEILVQKYFQKNANSLPVDEKTREDLIVKMREESEETNSKHRIAFQFFNPAVQQCLKVMESYFQRFLVSQEYQRFIASCTLPREYITELDSKKK